jgi:hypothetical protein
MIDCLQLTARRNSKFCVWISGWTVDFVMGEAVGDAAGQALGEILSRTMAVEDDRDSTG